jgi:hypothetical protein
VVSGVTVIGGSTGIITSSDSAKAGADRHRARIEVDTNFIFIKLPIIFTIGIGG